MIKLNELTSEERKATFYLLSRIRRLYDVDTMVLMKKILLCVYYANKQGSDNTYQGTTILIWRQFITYGQILERNIEIIDECEAYNNTKDVAIHKILYGNFINQSDVFFGIRRDESNPKWFREKPMYEIVMEGEEYYRTRVTHTISKLERKRMYETA